MAQPLIADLKKIGQEKGVRQISTDIDELAYAVNHSGYAKVVNRRRVRFLDFPTLKIHEKEYHTVIAIQEQLKKDKKQFEIFKRFDHKNFFSVSIHEQNKDYLKTIARKINPELVLNWTTLYEDMQQGVDCIKKLKVIHTKQKTAVGKIKYSLIEPPKPFIRKALETSESDTQSVKDSIVTSETNGLVCKSIDEEEKYKEKNERAKKWKNKSKTQVKFEQDEFPAIR